jgi:type IV pilus assembly protein PilV
MERRMRVRPYRTSGHGRGFTLLEVLIALLIFSLGLLGLAGLMVVSVKTNHSAYLRTQASFLAQSMVDRMRANIGRVNDYAGDYDASTADTDDACIAAACTPADLGARDRAVWSQQLITLLPQTAEATIACNGAPLGTAIHLGAAPYNGLCTFTINWSEATLDREGTGEPDPQTFAWVFQP